MADGAQLELAGLPAGWDVWERVQQAKRAGSYSLVRVREREQYEEVVRLLAQLSVDQVSRMVGWSWRTVAAVRDAESPRIAEQKELAGRKALSLAVRSMESYEEDLHAGIVDPKTKVIAAGILSERGLQLMGEATVIHATKAEGPRMDRGAFLDVLATVTEAPKAGPSDNDSTAGVRVCRGLELTEAVSVGGGVVGEAGPVQVDGADQAEQDGGGGGSRTAAGVGERMGKEGENF